MYDNWKTVIYPPAPVQRYSTYTVSLQKDGWWEVHQPPTPTASYITSEKKTLAEAELAIRSMVSRRNAVDRRRQGRRR